MLPPADTIAAIATARGAAALAVVRLSGPDALAVADRCFPAQRLATAPSHTAHVGYVTAPDGERLDQVVATVFRAPASPTGEDVVEFSCHGGDVAPQRVLRALLEAGARLARPGEFTERAFLHGKLDLAQAEAVADLIHARSTMAHRVALRHLEGRYSEVLASLREDLLHLAGLVELELDFAEEDVAFADRDELLDLVDRADRLLADLLGSHRLGRFVREGVRVAIAGRPNAGKSTLLNALLGRDRAIVSPTPGTTRDVLEAETEIAGLAFTFVDTAGLRATHDPIEAEGVRRAEHVVRTADLVLYVHDAALGLDADERAWLEAFAAAEASPPLLLVANKVDLLDDGGVDPECIPLSAQAAVQHPGALAPLLEALERAVLPDLAAAEDAAVVTRERHRQHLEGARAALARVRAALEAGISGDLLAPDLRAALRELGAITGATTTEDVLDAIFSRFCIGK